MKEAKIIGLMKFLKPEEVKEFQGQLKIQCNDREERVLRLFKYLLRYHPDFDQESKLKPERVFKYVFYDHEMASISRPNVAQQKTMKARLTNPSSLLGDYLEAFFDKKELDYNPKMRAMLRLRRYGGNDSSYLFQKALNTSIKYESIRITDHFDEFYTMEVFALRNRYSKMKEEKVVILLNLLDRIEGMNSRNLIKYGTIYLNGTKNYKEPATQRILQMVLDKASQNLNSKDDHTRLYSKSAQIVFSEDENIQPINSILTDLENTATRINIIDSENILFLLLNHCNTLIRKGIIGTEQVMLNLLLYGMKTGLLNEGQYIPSRYFKNIVFLASRLNKLDFAQTFIKENSNKLDPTIKETVSLLCKTQLFFNAKDYNSAIKFAMQDVFGSLEDLLVVHNILIRSYFELEDYDLLERQLDKFQYLIKKNKELRGKKGLVHLHFIKMVRLLSQANTPLDKNKMNLREKFLLLQPMASNQWISEKLVS